MDILVNKKGAKVLAAMITSCGSLDCRETTKLLLAVEDSVTLFSVGMKEDKMWRLAAFERIYRFCQKHKITELGEWEIAWYFGSDFHVDEMLRGGYRKLGDYLGYDKGLVAHILLPLNESLEYENLGKKVLFEDMLFLNPGEEGIPCYHLGLVVNIPLSQDQVKKIKESQADSKEFKESLLKITDSIKPPRNYLEGLKCTAGLD